MEDELKQNQAQKGIRLFYSYSHADEELRNELDKHLSLLKRQGIIVDWHDRRIAPGSEWSRLISDNLEASQIILLLISSDFLASDYCYDIEMKRALERHETGEAIVIPIILRPVDWNISPFGKLQALPRDGKPVIIWTSRDEAWLDIAKGIKLICDELSTKKDISSKKSPPKKVSQDIYPLYEVFKPSGVPTLTFVEPENFSHLKLAIAHPGRGVVIEGPSGIGKTTALKMAINQLKKEGKNISFKLYSARNVLDVRKISNIEEWHNNTVVIDDFHRLDKTLRDRLADYLKYLADNEIDECKLVVVGIPSTGKKLVDFAFDLAMRISVFKLGKVSDENVLKMIKKGEKALNIEFDRKNEIIRAASGSLNVGQLLCFHISTLENINGTQLTTTSIAPNLEKAITVAMEAMTLKFGEFVHHFSLLGGSRDWTCIELLKEIAHSDDGFLSLQHVRYINPRLETGIKSLLDENQIEKLYTDYPQCENHLFYDRAIPALVIDDPQLTFYLSHISSVDLAKQTGKVKQKERRKVFISYSHHDSSWAERLLVHLRPLELQSNIELWTDTRIKPGQKWREEIKNALDSAKTIILLISPDYFASDFISNYELPHLLDAAKKEGAIIFPVILKPSRFIRDKELSKFQAINDPHKPLSSLTNAKVDEVFDRLASVIEASLR
jgi:hypothetical protein